MTHSGTPPTAAVRRVQNAIAKLAMAFPDVKEEAPWGHRAFKVNGKAFLFMSSDGPSLGMSMKLPVSRRDALELPFTQSTGYGLGKSGWVSANFTAKDEVPLALVRAWLEESYRAIAPKRTVSKLDAVASTPMSQPAKKKTSRAAGKRRTTRGARPARKK